MRSPSPSLPVFLIGLEVMPKKLFRRYPFRSLRSGLAAGASRRPRRPVVPRLRRCTAVRRRAAKRPAQAHQTRGRDDLKALAQELTAQHQLSPTATHLIERMLDYKKLTAADVMQPLTRSIALAAEMPLSTALIVAREQNCTLLPVLGDNGSFIGVLDTTELPAVIPPDRLVRQHMRTLDTFPAALPALHAPATHAQAGPPPRPRHR
jgi:CBS domain containing-hemolysin-like protein